jgi:hypothetical protein
MLSWEDIIINVVDRVLTYQLEEGIYLEQSRKKQKQK